MSQLYVSDRTMVVGNGKGPTALFQAGVPRPIRPSLVEVAIGHGARPADGKAPELPTAPKPPTEGEIVAAIKRIMDRGRKSDLTADGQIRMKVLEKEVGYDIGVEDRDAAMALVSAVQDED